LKTSISEANFLRALHWRDLIGKSILIFPETLEYLWAKVRQSGSTNLRPANLRQILIYISKTAACIQSSQTEDRERGIESESAGVYEVVGTR